jgi:hypothetical protein
MAGLTSASSYALQKEGVSGGRMDKKKKALEMMAQRRPAMPSAPGAPSQPSAAPSVSNRFADVIAKRKAGKK